MFLFLSLTLLLSDGIPEQHPDLDPIKVEVVDGFLRCVTVACTVADAILQASQFYNVSHSRLSCLARRESTNNPNAVSPDGRYHGLMQFDRTTWQLTPYAHRSMYDEYASASAAAYLISLGQSSRWPVYRFC